MNKTKNHDNKNKGSYVSLKEVLEHAQLFSLSGKYEVIEKGNDPKQPAINRKKNPDSYIGLSDTNYPTAIVCDYIESLELYLTVIDIDNHGKPGDIPINIFEPLINEFKEYTYVVRTPRGGYHIYLLSREKPEAKEPKYNVDYKKNNGYVVFNYVWNEKGEKQKYIPLEEFMAGHMIVVCDNSDYLLEHVIKFLEDKGHYTRQQDTILNDIITLLRPYFSDGQRSNMSLGLSGYLRKKGFKKERAEQILNALVKDNPDAEKHLKTLEYTYENNMEDIIGYATLKDYILPKDLTELEKLISNDMSSYKQKVLQAVAKGKNPDKKVLSKYILSELELFRDSETKFYYVRLHDGQFKQIDEEYLINFINHEIGENVINRNHIASALNDVTRNIEIDYNLLVFNNGVLNTETREFQEFKDDYIMQKAPKLTLPFNWNSEAEPSRIGELVEQILYHPEYPDNKELWLRAVGHAFMSTNRIGKMVMVQGESGTGKSTLTTILKRIFQDSYSETKTQTIVENKRFTLYSLIGNSINIDDDIANGMLKGIGNLNTIVTGNGLEVEIKGKGFIKASNEQIPRLFANGNTLPPVIGTGFERRLLLIHANNQIPYKEKDEYLQSDILQGKYDTDGIEWLIYHSINLYLDKKDEAITSEAIEKRMNEIYEFKAYPLRTAVATIFTESWEDEDFIPKKDVFKYLKMWCKLTYKEGKISKEHLTPSKKALIGAMEDAGYTDSRKMTDKGKVSVYEYIKIDPKWEHILEPKQIAETSQQETLYQTLKQ